MTTLLFLYVLARFPEFIRKVKADGGEPNVVMRLVMSYQLNVSALIASRHRITHPHSKSGRVMFRFLYSIPLFIIALDGVQGNHPINQDP